MSAAKAIAVVGVAGRQDDVLARTILADPAAVSTVRALTRNTDSVHARQSAALGADVVEADPNDEQSMRLAYDGAYGAYAVHDSDRVLGGSAIPSVTRWYGARAFDGAASARRPADRCPVIRRRFPG
ncbi:NmrA family NAD(P)-binding protein [Streptomyces xiangluensis]|uniref:NmrA family NAD(P)-binding protein n=1 Tax=Streptomyces xiangluensis TaxID=2665720 RepID=A0ABV8Z5L3_9ACTN